MTDQPVTDGVREAYRRLRVQAAAAEAALRRIGSPHLVTADCLADALDAAPRTLAESTGAGQREDYICETTEDTEHRGTFAACLARYAVLLLRHGPTYVRVTRDGGTLSEREAGLLDDIEDAARERFDAQRDRKTCPNCRGALLYADERLRGTCNDCYVQCADRDRELAAKRSELKDAIAARDKRIAELEKSLATARAGERSVAVCHRRRASTNSRHANGARAARCAWTTTRGQHHAMQRP